MALKTSDSFFKFVTMGAASARRAIEILRDRGFEAHELERYSTSNKIWQTKIKRLRVPDLFCIRTGQRFEVRAKSKLEIKMSDSPTVAGREWDAGLRNDDLVVYLQCGWENSSAVQADRAESFTVKELRESVDASRLGPPKSAGEGAERDRQWPAVVASDSGEVLAVEERALRVRLRSGRRQSYQLRRKINDGYVLLHPYVAVGEQFEGGTEFLAGTPASKATPTPSDEPWDPVADLQEDSLSRYAAVKALGLRNAQDTSETIRDVVDGDEDARVRLEAVGSLLRLQAAESRQLLLDSLQNPATEDLRMEAVLIAGEVGNDLARNALCEFLSCDAACENEELLAAIIWSLGTKGCKDFRTVMEYLGHPSDLVATHAAVALGEHLDADLRTRLLAMLSEGNRVAATAAWVLEHLSADVVPGLVDLATSDAPARHWAVAVLGKRGRAVEEAVAGNAELRNALEPWWKGTGQDNWLADEEAEELVRFVYGQHF